MRNEKERWEGGGEEKGKGGKTAGDGLVTKACAMANMRNRVHIKSDNPGATNNSRITPDREGGEQAGKLEEP